MQQAVNAERCISRSMAPAPRINQPPSDIVTRGHLIHAPPAGAQPAHLSAHEVSTAFSVWAGSWVLAHYLGLQGDTLLQPRSILELGAGTGLAGLAAAAALRRPTTLTDLSEVLPQLRANVERNATALDDVAVRVAALDWIEARRCGSLPSDLRGPWDLVLAADCVWSAFLIEPFAEALSLACGPSTLALLAYTSRSGLCDRALADALASRGFSLTPLPVPERDSWVATALLYECRKVPDDAERPAPFDFEAHLIEVGVLAPDYPGKGCGLRIYDLSLPFFRSVR